ncbi:MAG TPA: small basic protein [Candidatus Omnitrophota bacterium]|nr:small basic protein [Candidatus Omnitrophota bacterium]
MSIHPSLKIDSASVQQRSVLTRIERIKALMKKGLWADENQSAVGLPKTKIVRIKAKKAVKKEETTAEGAAPAEAPTTDAKAGAKPAATKPAAKPAK